MLYRVFGPSSPTLVRSPYYGRHNRNPLTENHYKKPSPFLVRGGLRGELREPDDVGQADGDRAELLRRRNLTLLQLQEFGWGLGN